MRIVLLEFSPSGGLFQFAYQLGGALADHDVSVRLLTGPEPELTSTHAAFDVVPALSTWHPQRPDDNTPRLARKVRRFHRAGLLVTAWGQVLRYLRRERPDVVLFSTWRFSLDALGVMAVRRILPHATMAIVAHEPRPLVEQGQDGFYKTGGLLVRSLSRAWQAMDVAFVLGPTAATVLRDTWQPRADIVEIPHGDESVYATDQPPSAASTDPHILFFGTLTRYKGVDVLLDAFQSVRTHLPDAHLTVAGAVGPDLSGATLQRLRSAAGVTFRPGYVPLPDVAPLFAAARVVALPYLRASQSGVAHLAHTLARPVVASAVGDIPTAVTDGEDAWVVPPEDSTALAEALLKALTDPTAAAARGAAGRTRRTQESSWATIAETVLAALRTAANDRSRSADAPSPRR